MNNTRTIVEERSKNVAVMDVFSKLIQERIIFIDDVIDEELTNGVIAQMLYLDSLNCEFNSCKIAGSSYGIKRSEEFKVKISALTSGKNNPTYGLERTKEWRENISKANKGQKAWNKGKTGIYTEKTLLKIKVSALNREKILCEHCNNKVTSQNFKRWHGENCNYKNVPEGFKKCSNCKSVLNKENFNKNKGQLDGFNNQCKKCKSERKKNNYKSRNCS